MIYIEKYRSFCLKLAEDNYNRKVVFSYSHLFKWMNILSYDEVILLPIYFITFQHNSHFPTLVTNAISIIAHLECISLRHFPPNINHETLSDWTGIRFHICWINVKLYCLLPTDPKLLIKVIKSENMALYKKVYKGEETWLWVVYHILN